MPYTEEFDEYTEQIITKQTKSYGKCHACEREFIPCEEVCVFRGERYCDTDCIIKELEDSREIDTEWVEDGEE